MNTRIAIACAAGACALAAIGGTMASGHGGETHPATPPPALASVKGQTTVLLRSVDTRQATGVVRVIQRGARLRGFVVVWGLEPGSRHANHIHGNAVGDRVAACNPAKRRTMRHLADRPDLVADDRGVAFGVINERVTERAIRRGVYLMVHENPTPPAGTAMVPGMNPPLACANLG